VLWTNTVSAEVAPAQLSLAAPLTPGN